MTEELSLDPLAAYHAAELLQRWEGAGCYFPFYHIQRDTVKIFPRFMVKHLTDLLTTPTPRGAAADQPRSYEKAIFDKLKETFPLIVFSCVQLASKLSLHSHVSFNISSENKPQLIIFIQY